MAGVAIGSGVVATDSTGSAPTITGGTIDNAPIGGSTPAAVTGTTVTATTSLVGPLVNGQRLLGRKTGANMNSTADQAITILNSSKYLITTIYVTNASTSLTLAAGGVYPAASKAGTAIVAAAQVYAALTAATVLLPLTLTANVGTTALTAATLYLSLTTAQGTAATADIYIVGFDLT